MHCTMMHGGRDLPSSGEVVLGKGQIPCEFQADQTKGLVFMGKLRQGCSSRVLPRMVPCPWPAALGCEILHSLLTPALLHGTER